MVRKTLAVLNLQLEESETRYASLEKHVADIEKAKADAEAAAEAARTALAAQTTTAHRLVFDEPHKVPGTRGPASKMGDIVALLGRCEDVEDANTAYEAAVREVHTLIAFAGIDRSKTYRAVSKSSAMVKLCKMVRSHKRCPWMRHFSHDWATRRIIQQYMKSSRDNERKKRKAGGSGGSGRGNNNGAHTQHGHATRRQTTSVSVNISQLLDDDMEQDTDEDN